MVSRRTASWPWRSGNKDYFYYPLSFSNPLFTFPLRSLCFTIEEMDVTARAYSHFEAICLQHPDFGARRLPNDFPAVLLTNRTPQMVGQ